MVQRPRLGTTEPRSLSKAVPPRVSVAALRTADLARSTAFYTALGWELSAASTEAMSGFKMAGSLLLVCSAALLAELGGKEVAAALAGKAKGEAVLSIDVATDGEVDAAVLEAARAGGVVVKPASPTRWVGPVNNRRLAEALKAYTLASQACRQQAAP